jgi:tight adherence protein B
MNGARAVCGAVALWMVGLLVAFGAPASAADGATISHVEPTDGGVQILVSVPPGTDVVLDQVKVTIAGKDATSTAKLASYGTDVRRTTVLAIDTSDSMRGARFEAAKAAAEAYLTAVPKDVYVGIVTFDDTVKHALEPTLDRDAARATLQKLTLARNTELYAGVIQAVAMAGTEGQRSILLLSDGLDTGRTPLADVTTAIKAGEVLVDAVALEQSAQDSGPLQAMANTGNGQLFNAQAADLKATFAAEAAALARQVQVTAEIPVSVTETDAQISVILPTSDSGILTAEAFTRIMESAPGTTAPPGSDSSAGLQISKNLMYGAVAALGLGVLLLLGGVMTMATSGPDKGSVEARISQFTTGRSSGNRKADKDQDLRSQASNAAAQMLHRNQGLEARIANRLEASGSALKPAEWFLVHGGIAFGAGLVGLLLKGPLGLVIFLAVGAVFPWFWLGRKRSRRLKAFNSSLADTLQLMAGSLSAGLSLAQSVDTIVREGNEPVTSEFKRVLVEARLGVQLEDALEGVSERMQSKDFSWVVMAVRIQRQVGGNLAELLTTVSATLREREYLRRQVATLSAEGRLSAWILGGLPPAFTVYLILTKGDYVAPMFSTPVGYLMLAAAGTLLAVGIFWMSKLVKVEV